MQSNDELYSTDTDPVIASYQGYNVGQPEINRPGESYKNPREMMPIAGANETVMKDDENTINENAGDEQMTENADDTEDSGSGNIENAATEDTNDDTYYDATDVEGNATAQNKNRSITSEDDNSGVY